MKTKKKDKRKKITREAVERIVYITLIVVLVIYGLRDTEFAESATKLIHAVYEAFTLLLESNHELN